MVHRNSLPDDFLGRELSSGQGGVGLKPVAAFTSRSPLPAKMMQSTRDQTTDNFKTNNKQAGSERESWTT